MLVGYVPSRADGWPQMFIPLGDGNYCRRIKPLVNSVLIALSVLVSFLLQGMGTNHLTAGWKCGSIVSGTRRGARTPGGTPTEGLTVRAK
jgi:hypothetical protein